MADTWAIDTASKGFSLATGASNFLGLLGNFIKGARGDTITESEKLELASKGVDVGKYLKSVNKSDPDDLIPDLDLPSGFVRRSRQAPRAPLQQSNLLGGITPNQRLMSKIDSLISMKNHSDKDVTKLLANAGLRTPAATLKLTGALQKVGSSNLQASLKLKG